MSLKNIKKIKLSDYQDVAVIGTGSFGVVKLCKLRNSSKYYAVKKLKKSEILKLKQVDHIFSEIRILGELRNPFLIEMEGIEQDSKYVYIVLEYIVGGELFTYLREKSNFDCDEAR